MVPWPTLDLLEVATRKLDRECRCRTDALASMACLSLVGRRDYVSSAEALPPTEYAGPLCVVDTQLALFLVDSKLEDRVRTWPCVQSPTHAGEFLGANIAIANSATAGRQTPLLYT